MNRTLAFAIAALSLAGGSAGAQVPVRPDGGITVVGRASLTATPDVLHVWVVITPATQPMAAHPAPSANLEAPSNAVVAALKDAGATDTELSADAIAQGMAGTVSARLVHPNAASETALRHAAESAVAAYPQVRIAVVRITGTFDDCTAVERKLQTAAIADARSRAQQLASASGVKLGAPTAIATQPMQGASPPCQPSGWVDAIGDRYGLRPPPGQFEYGLAVSMTFAIAH